VSKIGGPERSVLSGSHRKPCQGGANGRARQKAAIDAAVGGDAVMAQEHLNRRQGSIDPAQDGQVGRWGVLEQLADPGGGPQGSGPVAGHHL
jgi:hypothetical protein